MNILKGEFEIKFLGEIKNCLGMKVTRNKTEGTLGLCQSEYIKNLLTKFGITNAKPASTPIALNVKLKKAEEIVNRYPYQQLIVGLLYLAVCTRPDIAYATSLLSQFNTCYNESHWIVAKRVLRYLKGTINHTLTFSKNENKLEAFADADWGGGIVDRKSYTGLVIKLGESVMSWECRKHKTIALSSTEAEYLSLNDAVKETIFIRNILGEIFDNKKTATLYDDSQSAQNMINNGLHHRRTKHIDIRHHFIKDALEKKIIKIMYKETNDMVADILTKPLSVDKHNKHVKGLGLKYAIK